MAAIAAPESTALSKLGAALPLNDAGGDQQQDTSWLDQTGGIRLHHDRLSVWLKQTCFPRGSALIKQAWTPPPTLLKHMCWPLLSPSPAHHCGLIAADDLHCHVVIAIQVVRYCPGDPVVAVVGPQLQEPVSRVNKARDVAHLDLWASTGARSRRRQQLAGGSERDVEV